MSAKRAPLKESHNLIVLSPDAVTILFPCGLNWAQLTYFVCPIGKINLGGCDKPINEQEKRQVIKIILMSMRPIRHTSVLCWILYINSYSMERGSLGYLLW